MAASYESNLGTKYSDSLPTVGRVIADVIQFFGGKRIYGVGGDFAASKAGKNTVVTNSKVVSGMVSKHFWCLQGCTFKLRLPRGTWV